MSMKTFSDAYFNGWNLHDCAAISASFTADGIYCDPTVGKVSGKKPEIFAEHLWRAFPDLNFEIVSYAEVSENRVVAEWVMRGTNTSSLNGLPPSGKTIMLKGIDVIEIGADGIQSVTGYFDTKEVPIQLGLDVVVQPKAIGPVQFGTSTTIQSGNKAKPGAFSITTLWSSDDQAEEIRSYGRETMKEMAGMEGFIGITTAKIGQRSITISAWEKPENVAQIMASPVHKEAMKRFYSNLSSGGFTSVWVPHHINPMWVRCTVCNKMNDDKKGVCDCGGNLASSPAYF